MNILYIAHEKNLGGATKCLLEIIDGLKNDNAFVLSNDKTGDIIDELKKRNVNIINAKYYWWMSYKSENIIKAFIKYRIFHLINIFTAIRLSFIVKKLNIDIIHTNTSVVDIGALISKFSGIKHIWHIREFGKEDHHIYFNFNKQKCIEFINKHSDKVISVSKSIYDKYKNYIDNNKICVIYDGIPESYLQRRKFIISNEVNILISGYIVEGKGQEEAILALKEVIKYKKLNELKVKLNIAGRGNPEYINKLKEMIKKLNMNNNIKILGYIYDMKKLRSTMDIELVCSKKEAFGRVTVEAMMSMMPVIGANTGGTKELIKDGFNGLLYEQGNYHDLANKILYLLKNRNIIKKIGMNAYEFARKNYTCKKNVEEIHKIYDQILSENS